MPKPLCICNGIIRSGSTWSYNVCRGLLQEQADQLKQPFWSVYLQADELEILIEHTWPTAPGPTVVKAHKIGPKALDALKSRSARAVCTYRDLRDCLASDTIFMNCSMKDSITRLESSLEFFNASELSRSTLLVRYEDMIADRRKQIRRIAEYLNVKVAPSLVSQIDDKTNIQTSRNICRSLKNKPADQVMDVSTHRVDPQTHLHENHIADAKVGKWKTVFTPQQGRWLTQYLAPWLLRFGYETPASLTSYLKSAPSTVPSSPAVD